MKDGMITWNGDLRNIFHNRETVLHILKLKGWFGNKKVGRQAYVEIEIGIIREILSEYYEKDRQAFFETEMGIWEILYFNMKSLYFHMSA